MIITLVAWIFQGSWMWHVSIGGGKGPQHILCWSRGWDPQLQRLDFMNCELEEHK